MKQRAKRLEMRKERTESEGQLQESVIHALSIVQRNMNSRNECTNNAVFQQINNHKLCSVFKKIIKFYK